MLCFTVNFKDFKKLVKKNGPGVLGIESQMTTEEMDTIITEFISGKDPADFAGKAIKI